MVARILAYQCHTAVGNIRNRKTLEIQSIDFYGSHYTKEFRTQRFQNIFSTITLHEYSHQSFKD